MAYINKGQRALIDDWYCSDVQYQTEGMFKVPLTDDECMQVLEMMADRHDANQGLNWDLMLMCIDSLFGDRELAEEKL